MDEKTILYVEDNFHNRRIVRKILGTRGYTVIEAEDGLVGYEMICELKPPLVLLDIALPHLDGIQIVQRLKADKEMRHIPVVALTASAMRGDKERFLEAGCDDYISKPVRAYELLEMVDRYFTDVNGKSDDDVKKAAKKKVKASAAKVKAKKSEKAEAVAEKTAESEKDEKAETVAEKVAKPEKDEKAEAVAEKVAEPEKDEKAETVAEKTAEPEKDTKAAAIAEKVIEPEKDEKAETVAEKTAEPEKDEKAEVAAEKVAESEKDKKTATIAEKVSDDKSARSKRASKAKVAKKPRVKSKADKVPASQVSKVKEPNYKEMISNNLEEMFSEDLINPPSPNVGALPSDATPAPSAVMPPKADPVPSAAMSPKMESAPIAVMPPKADPVPSTSMPPKAEAEPAPSVDSAYRIDAATIWIMDDNPLDSRLMRRIFGAKLKVDALEVSPSIEAISSMEHAPNLIIVGVSDPNKVSFEFLDAILSRDGMEQLPIFLLSKDNISPSKLDKISEYVDFAWLKEDFMSKSLLEKISDFLTNKLTSGRKKKAEAKITAGAPKPQEKKEGTEATVLVIEDIPDSAMLAKKILTNNNYSVFVADSGESGLKMALEHRPDMILLDLGLPDVDGQTLLGVLRAEDTLKDTPVIVCTAWPKAALKEIVESYGFDDYISKPYKVAEFMQVIKKNSA